MKIILTVVLVTLSSIVIFSCQKEVHDNITRRINQNPNDSVLLSEYIELNTTMPSGLDTLLKIVYTYDAEKRLKGYFLSDGVDYQTVEVFYSGAEIFPYKTVSFWSNFADVYRDTIFYSYTNGLVSKDSMIEYNNGTNQLFSIEARMFSAIGNNSVIQFRRYLTRGSPPDYEANGTVFKTYQNENIVVQDDSTYSTIGFAYDKHQEVKYDNKINPFYKALPIHYPILYYWLIAQPNNPIENISWENPGYQEHLIYSYSYRQDGYPISVKVIDQVSDSWNGLFFYTK
jgi:hypothetical protein